MCYKSNNSLGNKLYNLLTEEEKRSIKCDKDIIKKFDLSSGIGFNDGKCICGANIKTIYYVEKESIKVPIGSTCINKWVKYKKQFDKYNRELWNADKFCKYCKRGNLKNDWGIHKKCYGAYKRMLSEKKRIYLNVKYQDKNKAKKLGCKWDPEKRLWYCFYDNENKEKILKKYK